MSEIRRSRDKEQEQVSVALGKAYDFERQRYPKHMYEVLDVIADHYKRGDIKGGIAVCGRGEMKALAAGLHAPRIESAEQKRYLVTEHKIPPELIYEDPNSTNTPENMLEILGMAMRYGWERADIFTAAPRADRIDFLAKKVCFNRLETNVVRIPSDEQLPDEAKLLGDMVCTLKDMEWGDPTYLLNAEGKSRWDELRTEHHKCEFYVPGNQAAPGVNYHPPELMRAYGVPPTR